MPHTSIPGSHIVTWDIRFDAEREAVLVRCNDKLILSFPADRGDYDSYGAMRTAMQAVRRRGKYGDHLVIAYEGMLT